MLILGLYPFDFPHLVQTGRLAISNLHLFYLLGIAEGVERRSVLEINHIFLSFASAVQLQPAVLFPD